MNIRMTRLLNYNQVFTCSNQLNSNHCRQKCSIQMPFTKEHSPINSILGRVETIFSL